MTFLAPTALIFLFGIGIPVLIHFLNRFNVKKVKFSSVQFLKSMEDNSIRNVKFKKFILLILDWNYFSTCANVVKTGYQRLHTWMVIN